MSRMRFLCVSSFLYYRFEEKFRYDDHGLPRVWKPEDDIDSYFKRAKEDVRYKQLLLLL
jgi:hypothetical protein